MKCRRQKHNQSKDPNEPIKPPKAYTRYSRTVWERVASENPGMNIGQIGNTVGKMWRNISDAEKEVFNQEYKEDMIKYESEMSQYIKSAGYTEWLKKSEEIALAKVKESPKKQIAQIEKMVGGKDALSENSYIQAELDSDEEVNFMDIKMESSNRFYRNHSLMLELFSDTRIPKDDKIDCCEPSDMEMESQIAQVQSQMTIVNNNHLNRLMEINEKKQNFERLMQLENEKLQNLIQNPKLCD